MESPSHLPACVKSCPVIPSVLRPAPSAHRCKHGESLVRQALPITWENSAKKEKKKSSGRRGKNDGPHCTRTSHPVTPHFPTHRVWSSILRKIRSKINRSSIINTCKLALFCIIMMLINLNVSSNYWKYLGGVDPTFLRNSVITR